ncbi:uncharacterized protein DS421_17g588480 [Arachis hypogaea]|nr:uncharacterized protein DS421_17g588480 [Arachis hypogaea]
MKERKLQNELRRKKRREMETGEPGKGESDPRKQRLGTEEEERKEGRRAVPLSVPVAIATTESSRRHAAATVGLFVLPSTQFREEGRATMRKGARARRAHCKLVIRVLSPRWSRRRQC